MGFNKFQCYLGFVLPSAIQYTTVGGKDWFVNLENMGYKPEQHKLPGYSGETLLSVNYKADDVRKHLGAITSWLKECINAKRGSYTGDFNGSLIVVMHRADWKSYKKGRFSSDIKMMEKRKHYTNAIGASECEARSVKLDDLSKWISAMDSHYNMDYSFGAEPSSYRIAPGGAPAPQHHAPAPAPHHHAPAPAPHHHAPAPAPYHAGPTDTSASISFNIPGFASMTLNGGGPDPYAQQQAEIARQQQAAAAAHQAELARQQQAAAAAAHQAELARQQQAAAAAAHQAELARQQAQQAEIARQQQAAAAAAQQAAFNITIGGGPAPGPAAPGPVAPGPRPNSKFAVHIDPNEPHRGFNNFPCYMGFLLPSAIHKTKVAVNGLPCDWFDYVNSGLKLQPVHHKVMGGTSTFFHQEALLSVSYPCTRKDLGYAMNWLNDCIDERRSQYSKEYQNGLVLVFLKEDWQLFKSRSYQQDVNLTSKGKKDDRERLGPQFSVRYVSRQNMNDFCTVWTNHYSNNFTSGAKAPFRRPEADGFHNHYKPAKKGPKIVPRPNPSAQPQQASIVINTAVAPGPAAPVHHHHHHQDAGISMQIHGDPYAHNQHHSENVSFNMNMGANGGMSATSTSTSSKSSSKTSSSTGGFSMSFGF